MPIKRRVSKVRKFREVPEALWEWLKDRTVPDSGSDAWWKVFTLEMGEAELHGEGAEASELPAIWGQVRDELLAEWVEDHPGTRPWLWWKLDAPRMARGVFSGCFYDGVLQEPRRLLSGAGRPGHEVSAYVPSYEFGLPQSWAGVDTDDPPTFESQASYLKRHELLLPGESRRLTTKDFAPEVVTDFESDVTPLTEAHHAANLHRGRRSGAQCHARSR